MLYNALCTVSVSQKLFCKFHIAGFQRLSDIGTADFPFSIHCLFYNLQLISIALCILFQHTDISSLLMTKMKICSHCNVCGMQLFNQDLFNKFLCFHLTDCLSKRTDDQRIHTSFQICFLFLACHQCFFPHIKCKNNTFRFFLIRKSLNPADQFLMSSMKTVKLSECDSCPVFCLIFA